MTTPDPRTGNTPGVRSDVPGVRVSTAGTPAAAAPGGTPPGAGTPSSAPPPTPSGAGAPLGKPQPVQPAAKQRHRGRSIGLSLAAALLIFVTVILVLFVMFNTQTVEISLVFGDVQAPLVLALVIAAVLGGLVVATAGLAMRARHKER